MRKVEKIMQKSENVNRVKNGFQNVWPMFLSHYYLKWYLQDVGNLLPSNLNFFFLPLFEVQNRIIMVSKT